MQASHRLTETEIGSFLIISGSAHSQIVLKNFIKIGLIIKECPAEILIKLAIVLKISKSS
jgi:hypothetical protein